MDKIAPLVDHPLKKYVYPKYEEDLNYFHNSVENNPKYPRRKPPIIGVTQFTIIGYYLAKEFIECAETINLFYTYRKDKFKKPIIQGVTAIEWPVTMNHIKIKFPFAYRLTSEVCVLLDGELLGGENELKDYLQQHFQYYVTFDYRSKVEEAFVDRVKASRRPHVYMHIEMDEKYIGTLIFMLYDDIVPLTCENFIRLCNLKRGGYSGTPIHRVVKDAWIQCGGFGLKAPDIPCENYVVKHDQRGVLCMANDGRNSDNSTQFFVLLQPAEWMTYKYVAFGQLIEGEETLMKIEQVPTYYESPKVKITIMDAGSLKLEPHDTRPDEGAKEFVESHIEDLVDLGNYLINLILDNVYDMIEFEDHDLRDAKRFVKDDIQHNMERVIEEQMNYEELSYHHVSLDSKATTEIPREDYYLPLTDVPYPGEKDSVFDFKRFLKGYYCLESDLYPDEHDVKKSKAMTSRRKSSTGKRQSFLADSDDDSLNSVENAEIREYVRVNADKVSFGGRIIRRIATSDGDHERPSIKSSQLVNDEYIRRPSRKVSIKEPEEVSFISESRKSWDRDESIHSNKGNIKFREDSTISTKNKMKDITSLADQPARFSVLTRLCERKKYNSIDTGPTFNEYGLINLEKNNFFLTRCRQSFSEDMSREKCAYMKSPLDSPPPLISQIMPHELERKISVNYVKIMDMSRRHKQSIRSVQYERYRPSMTIEKYQELSRKQ